MVEIEVTEEIIDEDDKRIESDSLIIFVMSNPSQYQATVTLNFDSLEKSECNFRVPFTERSFLLGAGAKDVMWKFSKSSRLVEGWGDSIKDLRIMVDGVDIATERAWSPSLRDYS